MKAEGVILLCADDEPDIRAIIELALGLDPSIQAEIVSSGSEVLERVTAGKFDAVVLDGAMPGIDGYETCRRLKRDPETSYLPVVFLTANTQRAQRELALECGAIDSITKPFDPMTLAGQLRRILHAPR